MTILTRKIVEIETQLKILYEQQEMLKQELSMKATLQAQQELTDIQMIIYEKKQVMSQLRTEIGKESIDSKQLNHFSWFCFESWIKNRPYNQIEQKPIPPKIWNVKKFANAFIGY